MSWAAMLLAVAVLIAADPLRVRVRAGVAAPRAMRRRAPSSATSDPLAAASAFDVLAACLSSGMAVSTAAAATAPTAPPTLAAVLTRASDLLALGADPATAWSHPGAEPDPQTRALLRLARRSASSGAALAQGVAELAVESRSAAADAAGAAAERASVLIAAPLGLCYLPAFLCLGIVPVVAGLAGDVLQTGVL
ncbi:type II secretion system F family protein [Mycobacterium sp. NPDC050041]|uniref:type II secretion system F family protein n=1 Tax=Mycobacterium sp. NPDC050041 TaxID=3364293 RepID=UPI003C2CF7E5